MPSRKRKALSAAVIGVATTALTVKGAIAGPIAPVAKEPLKAAEDTLAQASSGVASAIVQPPTVGHDRARHADASSPSRTTTPPAKGEELQNDPEKRLNPAGSNTRALARRLLHDAAVRHGIDPKLVLAVSYWESGWDQSRVSETGAVGLMQVEPYMADSAGPSLLGRSVDLTDPYDNADLGVAILKDDLRSYADPVLALAAYYEGPTALQQNGLTPDAQQYANGVLSLAAQMR